MYYMFLVGEKANINIGSLIFSFRSDRLISPFVKVLLSKSILVHQVKPKICHIADFMIKNLADISIIEWNQIFKLHVTSEKSYTIA